MKKLYSRRRIDGKSLSKVKRARILNGKSDVFTLWHNPSCNTEDPLGRTPLRSLDLKELAKELEKSADLHAKLRPYESTVSQETLSQLVN